MLFACLPLLFPLLHAACRGPSEGKAKGRDDEQVITPDGYQTHIHQLLDLLCYPGFLKCSLIASGSFCICSRMGNAWPGHSLFAASLGRPWPSLITAMPVVTGHLFGMVMPAWPPCSWSPGRVLVDIHGFYCSPSSSQGLPSGITLDEGRLQLDALLHSPWAPAGDSRSLV